MNQALCGATSQMKPRKRDLPQKLNITAKLIFNIKHAHVTPVKTEDKISISIRFFFFKLNFIDSKIKKIPFTKKINLSIF